MGLICKVDLTPRLTSVSDGICVFVIVFCPLRWSDLIVICAGGHLCISQVGSSVSSVLYTTTQKCFFVNVQHFHLEEDVFRFTIHSPALIRQIMVY